MNSTKPINIDKNVVWKAWKLVKANAGSAGVDGKSITDFERKLKDNLYKIWNRMSSGSYFPPPVLEVEIPKRSGGTRTLGVPTVGDRVAQMVVKLYFEPIVEKEFLPDSYGYRPGKSAHDAIRITQTRCWKYDWLLEFDIRGLFDNIRHDLLLKAVSHHTDSKWIILYIKRWLRAPIQINGDQTIKRDKGTPQGGVISPVLSNLFLHYVFDKWMGRKFPGNPWCRYADDGLAHCNSHEEALNLRSEIEKRFEECGLELHPSKTKIVYCKDGNRKSEYSTVDFKFLGFQFRRRSAKNRKNGKLFLSFLPAIDSKTIKEMRRIIKRDWRLRLRTDKSLEDLAKEFNPVIRGWFQYYGKFYPTELRKLANYLNDSIVKWARRKFKKLRIHKVRAYDWLKKVHQSNSRLFAHWRWFEVY